MEAVASAGYHAVAPEPRGYLPTSLPADGDYRIARLAEDVVPIADYFGAEYFSIVGHDLGAMTGYAVANLAPRRVQRLITASVPHTGHFLLNIRTHQALRSRYIAFFQLPRWPERTVARNDFARRDHGRKPRTRVVNASGASHCGKWPAPGHTTG